MALENEPTFQSLTNALSALLHECGTLRAEISQLRGELQANSSPSQLPQVSTPHVCNIRVFFTRRESPRKPIQIEWSGDFVASLSISAVRAALLISLLLDLEDRLDGGYGSPDITAEAKKFLLLLQPESESSDLDNSIRVALYRFSDFIQESTFLKGASSRLIFDQNTLRLQITRASGEPWSGQLDLEINTDIVSIVRALEVSFSRTPLSMVRKRRALFVPPGPLGVDSLLLEMYNHPHPLKVTSLYVRPPFQSYPVHLLELMGISDTVMARKRLAFDGYASGRFEFLEILPKVVMWNLIRVDERDKFIMYPPQITAPLVLDHLDNLIYILTSFKNYQFYVTDADIPFALVTYEIASSLIPEYFAVFFQSFATARERDLGCFVLRDPHVFQGITEHIVRWIISHGSTIRERDEVISFVSAIRNHLATKGPLTPEHPHPEGI
jgi:hypothetical protein